MKGNLAAAVLLLLASLGCMTGAVFTQVRDHSDVANQITTTSVWGIKISTDKTVYSPGEVVRISGNVTGGPEFYCPPCPPGATCICTCTTSIVVELEIRDPLGTLVYSKTLNLGCGSEPPIVSYSDSYSLSGTMMSGIYEVFARAISSGYPIVEAGSNFRLEGTATTRDCGHWVVATDKGEYSTGETVHITGRAETSCVTFGWGTSPIIRLNYSSGSVEIRGQPYPGTTCTNCGTGGSDFYADWQIPSTFSSGAVTITVFDQGLPGAVIAAGEASFTVTAASTVCITTTTPHWAITVSTDKSVYGPSDIVQIAGSVSGGPSCSCPCGATCTCTFTTDIGYMVQLEIRNGLRTVYARNLTLVSQWVFSDSFSLSYALESGDYQVIARVIYQSVEARSNFRLEGTATTIVVTVPSTTIVTTTTVSPATAQTSLATLTASTTVSTVVTLYTTVGTGATLTALAQGLVMQVSSNSSVSNLVFDSSRRLLNFTVSGPTGSYGFFDVAIAKSLLSGQPIVMIDGVEQSASISEDANFWYIHVTYSHSEHHVTIGGSNTIPEFPSILVLTITFVLAMVIVRRRTE